MVSFRKAFLLLALTVITVGVASAQFTCNANSGAPTIARQEGVAEETGQIVLTCTGGNPAVTTNSVNISIFLNTQVTSRLINDAGTISEALLLIDEPAQFASDGVTPNVVIGTNAFQGSYSPSIPNAVQFNGIPLNPPATGGTRIVRIVNIRANASAITSSSFIPGNITAFIAITGTGAPGVTNNAQQVVAFVQKGLEFGLRTSDDKALSNLSLTQCNSLNADAGASSPVACPTFRARFTELFGTAFRPQGGDNQAGLGGTVYNTESMYTNSSIVGAVGAGLLGRATQATRLRTRFTNIPAGVRIYLTNTNLDGSVLLFERSSTDSGAGTGTTNCAFGGLSSGSGYTALNADGTATWNLTSVAANHASTASTVDFGVIISFSANGVTPTTSPTQVAGSYAPINTSTPIGAVVNTDSSTSGARAVPRFIDTGVAVDAFSITACRTNLLFPFVTNQAGFDTGIAISNTSIAPTGFSGSQQSGACIVNFYGQTTGGGAAPAAQTSGSVPAGSQLVFTLSGGGGVIGSTPSINPAAGFQGYIIAQCNFQYAHGFAFVSDLGSSRLAEGYLALVMDSAVGTRTGSNASESLNN